MCLGEAGQQPVQCRWEGGLLPLPVPPRASWGRESSDHGPINAWDRQVYLTDVRTGKPDVMKQWDDISHNFIIANYNSQEAIDTDSGSW
jgi:hypothetical protein